ncbi:MAG: alpha/beta fold hydrolase [Bdellovibrionales bacterium]|nr:alpha/beta fold hydrolase [Bdellovibrionales bacterium]
MSNYKLSHFILFLILLNSAYSHATNTSCNSALTWQEVHPYDVAVIPYLFRHVPLNHPFEKRGFVTVPLDYDRPKLAKIKIFYRLFPTVNEVLSGQEQVDAPILVIINGGPGVPSSKTRPYDFDYSQVEETDLFVNRLGNLSKYFRILMLDQRGTDGMSAPLNLDHPNIRPEIIAKYFGTQQIARDHQEVINEVIPEHTKFYILGQSYGGGPLMRYLMDDNIRRKPHGAIFASALLPGDNSDESSLARRQEQYQLNMQLKEAYPDIEQRLHRLGSRFLELGLARENVNYLWYFLGRGNKGEWEVAFADLIDELMSKDKTEIQEFINQQSEMVSLLNYVLSSANITPGYTDKTKAIEIAEQIPFPAWMVDESWVVTKIGLDGSWRESMINAIDQNPPPPDTVMDLQQIKKSFGNIPNILFTFGEGDSMVPANSAMKTALQLHVPSITRFGYFPGGHSAAFREIGAKAIADWIENPQAFAELPAVPIEK